MAEARGLSRAILQAPDIIGEQRQVDALEGQQALQRERLAASQASKPFDISKYNFGGLKYGMDVADDSIYKQFEEKIFDVVRNQGPDAARVLANRFQNQYNNLKNTVGQNLKSSFDIKTDLDPERYSALGFAGLLADQQYISDNVVVDDQFNIMLKDADGQLIPLISHPSIQDPQSYYRKPADYLTEGVDAMQLAYRKVEDGDITTQSLDEPKMLEQANLYMQTKVKNDPDLLNNTVNRYLTEELGIPANKSVGDAILAEGEYRYTDANGNPAVITQKDVLSWGANNIFESTRPRASFTQTQDEGRGKESDWEKMQSKLKPISKQETTFLGKELPISIKSGFVVPSGIKIYGDVDGEQVLFDIQSVYRKVDSPSEIFAYGVGKRGGPDETRQGVEIPLGEEQVRRLETELDVPEGLTLLSVLEDDKFKFKIKTEGLKEGLLSPEESPVEKSPIEGYSIEEVQETANAAKMSIEDYVNWYNETQK